MKKRLEDYIEKIKHLPLKTKYTKEDLFIEDFLIDSYKNLKIYYTPHNEYINKNAKILIVGITPGFQQMSYSILMARKCIEEKMDIERIKYLCKLAGRLSGGIRKNIIQMFDEIKLNEAIGVKSFEDVFNGEDKYIHTTSLVSYPVFQNNKNYSGHTPKIYKNEFLMKYVYENFLHEISMLKDVLIIPLGKGVEEVISILDKEGALHNFKILKGFPHPSGVNAHRYKQLEENKDSMIRFIKENL